ncbi:MAG: divergent PAP2 family protein [Candidatus Latescibacteria bacterium]|nr:divergent PAP2 family protein [Candidatus Latescibacterota bacterium]NIM21517.1 divergent PAP2 family protein [Candidatus Latescibacterota bacterium]NIM65688.1 divergent PAP2 family protein [Candidatus Latescibacterota bacterium]NIO02070.1 divergent PAP2 family protein [Candidatus Latescibacterota bacterium]NIO28882.1 divergent PAP2 family protein [Candidatus Latescibacterota bacterium]
MIEVLQNKPFLVAIFAGTIAQAIKVLSFLLVEKKVNYRRFVQADGSPNMHAAALSALGMAVGFKDGFGALPFALVLSMTILICVDTMNVKNAASRQAEVMQIIVERIRKRKMDRANHRNHGMSYSPINVLSGVAVGVVFALIIF